MEASAKSIAKILHSSDQFLVPFFQRYYKWGQKEWKRLRDDLWALTEDGHDGKHFLGPLVCTAVGGMPGDVTAFQLIDGQQRLTTLTLLLAALRDVADQQQMETLAAQIEDNYLVHKYAERLQRYKVVPRTGDRDLFIAIVDRKPIDSGSDLQIAKAYNYFLKQVREVARDKGEEGLAGLFQKATGGLYLVVITIDEENPYEIFESLNSTGLPLAESDLIRNYLFMHVPQDEQQEFHGDFWDEYEKMFDATERHEAVSATAFYRNFLMRSGTYSRAKSTFLDFKDYYQAAGLTPQEQVEELRRFAVFELRLRRPDTHPKKPIAERLAQIEAMEVTTSHPLLLNLFDRHDRGELAENDLLSCLNDLASFVLRRSICGESTRRYGVWFCEAIAAIKDDPRQDLRGYWLHRGWPDDSAFIESLIDFPVYRRDPKKCRLMLETLEEKLGHKERVDPTTLSIEHVMPQTLSGAAAREWRQALGDDWKAQHEQWLHVLGNLTLSGYNPDLSNNAFAIKRDAYQKSNVSLNEYFADCDQWGVDEIEQRGRTLAERVARHWPRPKGGPVYVPSDGRKRLRAGKERRTAYWNQLLDKLRSERGWNALPKSTGETRLEFPTGVASASLFVWFKLRQQQMVVGLALPKRRGRAIFRALEADRDAVERDLGFPLQWRRKGSRSVTVSLPEVSIKDSRDWGEQHERLAENLAALRDHLVPRVRETSERLDDSSLHSKACRSDWEDRVGPAVLGVCDEVLSIIDAHADGHHGLHYRVHYIAIQRNGESGNVAFFLPRQRYLWLGVRPKDRELWRDRFTAAGFEAVARKKRVLRIRVEPGTIDAHRDLFEEYLGSIVAQRRAQSPWKDDLLDFWREFADRLESSESVLRPHKPRARHWMDFALGRSHFRLVASVDSIGQRASVAFLAGGPNVGENFQSLRAEAQQIEAEIGEPLEWHDDPSKKSRRAYVRRPNVDVRDRKNWPGIQDWMIEKLELFHRVFGPRVRQLN